MARNVRFSGKKNLVVVNLLSGSTIEQASLKAGVSTRQVFRWLNEPVFVEEIRRQERQVLDGVSWRLVSLSKKALDALEDVLERPNQAGASNKRLSAVAVLELTLKYQDLLTFETRLQNLELSVYGTTQE